MKLSLISPFSLGLLIQILFFLITAITLQAVDDFYYSDCSKPHSCGPLTEIKYPFWRSDRPPYCGLDGYQIECQYNKPIFNMSSQLFVVHHIEKSNFTMVIAREDLSYDICPSNFIDTTIDLHLVNYSSTAKNLTLFYVCTSNFWDSAEPKEEFKCRDNHSVFGILAFPEDKVWNAASEECKKNIKVPVMLEIKKDFKLPFTELIKNRFEVGYEKQAKMKNCKTCEKSGGVCGTNRTTTPCEFTCFCKDKPHSSSCPEFEERHTRGWQLASKSTGKSHVKRNIGIAFAALVGALLIAGLALLLYRKKRTKTVISSWESRDISSYGSSVLDLEKSSSYYGVQVFEYNDLQEATNNFDENKELGDGGFGVVYQGKLRDGRVVAVKRLYERSFKRAEQFKNEVEILAKLRHRNLVTLYGCTSRSSRELLLVYEYVSNGTVADHLHGEQAKPGSLPWTTRMSIAVETADALLFLHKSDVIHRDVKTNNILLDGNFVVKVADFGLSRLYPNNVTHVSTAPQGTPGYVDPEYHQCYRLTNKSDVYSFGVVLIELISSMPAVDITRHRHYINLANMAIDKIQNHALSEIVDPYLGFDSDFKVKKMINGVAELAFQCLQDGKDMRPTMEEAFEILKTISSEDYCAIIEEMEISGDGVELLKSEPPAVSSGSTSSNCTTPVTSG